MAASTTDRTRWPASSARAVAIELLEFLAPACTRIEVAGSLRRGRPDVGDVELVYVPRMTERRTGLFDVEPVDATLAVLDGMLERGIIERRLSVRGTPAWGEKNKLAMHRKSGIPVDLFATTATSWWNYLVCRTGPADSNERIAREALRQGLRWRPYGAGFEDSSGRIIPVTAEADVWRILGLPYQTPEER